MMKNKGQVILTNMYTKQRVLPGLHLLVVTLQARSHIRQGYIIVSGRKGVVLSRTSLLQLSPFPCSCMECSLRVVGAP